VLRQIPVLWIWDNVEPVPGFPRGTPSAWSDEEQAELVDFLRAARDTHVIFRTILGHVFSPIEGQGLSPKLVHLFSPKVGHSFSAKVGHSDAGGIPPPRAYSLLVEQRGERRHAWKEERHYGHQRDPETPTQRTE
jgi:hypothetical protein